MKMCESDYIPENISSGTAYLAYFVSHETRSVHRLYFVASHLFKYFKY